MKITFLGTGTSTGVPQIRCNCSTCRSLDSRDHRLRASVLCEVDDCSLLIDCGPDFRTQMLRIGSPRLDALLITHQHYDHVGGVDDLRPYCTHDGFPIYCQENVASDLRECVPYCFVQNPYPGVPHFQLHNIEAQKPFTVKGVEILPLHVDHYKLSILGYRIGDTAYITDANHLSEATMQQLKGLDTLVLNALRHEPHMSHFSLPEALEVVERLQPRVTYLTHLSHQMGRYLDIEPALPAGVHLAYDMLTISAL
ncbi:MAG: MBL fold metallo-hydrolase [Muribaculaceae bacterium]|nr:MBL fold metallo-hydrolase [Muribaculaceae bacterium]